MIELTGVRARERFAATRRRRASTHVASVGRRSGVGRTAGKHDSTGHGPRHAKCAGRRDATKPGVERDDDGLASVQGGLCGVEGGLGSWGGEIRPWGAHQRRGDVIGLHFRRAIGQLMRPCEAEPRAPWGNDGAVLSPGVMARR